jgi:hypothetical protein
MIISEKSLLRISKTYHRQNRHSWTADIELILKYLSKYPENKQRQTKQYMHFYLDNKRITKIYHENSNDQIFYYVKAASGLAVHSLLQGKI